MYVVEIWEPGGWQIRGAALVTQRAAIEMARTRQHNALWPLAARVRRLLDRQEPVVVWSDFPFEPDAGSGSILFDQPKQPSDPTDLMTDCPECCGTGDTNDGATCGNCGGSGIVIAADFAEYDRNIARINAAVLHTSITDIKRALDAAIPGFGTWLDRATDDDDGLTHRDTSGHPDDDDDDDPTCVCGVARSEHSVLGCADGFRTPAQWARERAALYETYERGSEER